MKRDGKLVWYVSWYHSLAADSSVATGKQQGRQRFEERPDANALCKTLRAFGYIVYIVREYE